MTDSDRIPRWRAALAICLADAAQLVSRGRDEFDRDIALPLAFEALSNRIGDLAKKLIAADPGGFTELIWSQAARNGDFVVHQYHRLDQDALWTTVSVDFTKLAQLL